MIVAICSRDAAARRLSMGGGFGRFGRRDIHFGEPHAIDVPDEAELLEYPDNPAGRIDLVPGHAGIGGTGMGMVVVVPAFAEREDRDEPVVLRRALALEPLPAPCVTGAVDQ